MSVQRLPGGRYRATIIIDGKRVSAQPGITYRNKTEAREACRKALDARRNAGPTTVGQFWACWTSDPLFARPKHSTNMHNRERTRAFCERYASLKLADVTSSIVSEWIAGGKNLGTVPALRAMFGDAARPKAGELIIRNPFANLGLKQSKGNVGVDPPSIEMVDAMIVAARKLTSPSFAAWLELACFTGMRPAEIDALQWHAVDFEAGSIMVCGQWSRGSFTLPKNGQIRKVAMGSRARSALVSVPNDEEFCFTNFRGHHWTGSSRAYHWNAVRASVDYAGSLYLATRHFAGWYMRNVLKLDPEDIAIQLGHQDGGDLVRRLYGHRSQDDALDLVRRAYEQDSAHIQHAGRLRAV